MKRRWLASLVLLAAPACTFAQEVGAVWSAISQPAFDPQKSASVSNLTIERDRLRLELQTGSLQFTQPANGLVFGAVFRGQGRFRVEPPSPVEARHLWVATGERSVDLEFTEATFSFTDDTFAEMAGKLTWGGSAVDTAIYQERQQAREDVGAEILPRLLKGLLSANRKQTAFFVADLKTKSKGWVHAQFDALDPEEITVGRWNKYQTMDRFDSWLKFPAGGKDARTAHQNPVEKDDYQVRSYVIDATVTMGAELLAVSRATMNLRLAGERLLIFHLDANLRVESVKDKGTALTFFQPRDPRNRTQSYGDFVAVALAAPTAAGEDATLEFRYAGKRVVRKEGNGTFFSQSYGWYPARPDSPFANSSFSSRADFELNFRSPKRYTLVATGNKISETTDGDWDITVWKSDLPLAVAGFAFGDYKVVTEKVGDVDVEVYANRSADDLMSSIQQFIDQVGPRDMTQGNMGPLAAVGNLTPANLAKPVATEMGNTLRIFEKYFGPFPYKRLAVSNLPLNYSYGQGWPMLLYISSISFLDSQQRNTLGIQDHVGVTDFFRAHESSHQWWGHRVGWKSYHDQWLSEGFAQFSGNLYVQFTRGEKEFLNRLRLDRQDLKYGDLKGRSFESLGPVWMGLRLISADAPQAYSMVVYRKGGLVLHMLRMMLLNPRAQNQEERFIAMMQEFTRTFHNQSASTEDFKALAEKHMTSQMDVDGNHRLDWFFDQYVYGVGIPEYSFRYSIEPTADGKFKVSGTATRSGVPESWKDILPVYVSQGGRTVRLGWIKATQRVTQIDFLLPTRPDKVIVNANEDILAEIKQ